MKKLGWHFLIVLLLLLVGCAPKPRGEEPLQAIDKSFADSDATRQEKVPPPPPEISAALLPKPASGIVDDSMSGEPRFDISADRVSAREFFLGLVKGTSINIVVHPQVEGQISLALKNTTLSETLEVVGNVYGYPYIKTGSVYQVLPLGLQTRTFSVNYLNLVRKGKSETRISSGQVSQTESDENTIRTQVPGSLIETESTADFWSELEHALKGIVGTEEGRTIVVQAQASAVVVVAMPEELQAVEAYLQTIQQNLQRQVVIEARIIEVTLDDGFQSGINWGALADGSELTADIGQTGGGSILKSGMATFAGAEGNLGKGGTLPGALGTSAFGGAFSMALSLKNFKTFIELLQQQGDVQVLSSPRVSTVNNQKAVIKVGTDEFFLTDVSSNTVTGTSASNSVDITLTPFFSGIALDVTPQIDARGGVILHVHPTVSEVNDQTKQLSVFGGGDTGNQTLSLPLAKSTVRESDSIVRAESGQIVMIGGLMKDKQVQQEAGVPVLSSIPVLGALFRHTKTVSQKSELVILLRPHIIADQADWRELLESSRQRIEVLSPQLKSEWAPTF
jgi:MSHA biogenesis protein MshL